jgi:hypothetical protein
MRKFVLLVTGVFLAGAVAAATGLAQTSSSPTVVTGTTKVIPNNAGTKAHPQGVKLKVTVHWRTPSQFDPPIIQKGVVLFPKGSLYNGAKFPRCSANTMNRKGLTGCPKGSIMGKGTGNAFADTVVTHPQITVVNGGPKNVCLFTVLNNPARVQACVPGTIKKMSGKWAYQLTLKVPQVLQVVAGVPIQLTDLTVSAGKGKWLATTGCSGGKWPYMITTFYDNGTSSSLSSSTPCKK